MVRNMKLVPPFEWGPNFAYAVGLITSDGCLHTDGRHIIFASKEMELAENFKKAFGLQSKISRHVRGGETEKRYLQISYSNKALHSYLQTIGLTPHKSKTIQFVQVPKKFFPDFLRGLFDGDGTFYFFWDKRWPRSFCFKMSFASASRDFIEWLKETLTEFYGVRGFFHAGAGVTNLEYVKGDSRKLFEVMYYKRNLLCFSKKFSKVKNALEKDRRFGSLSLQKPRNAAVAQW